MNNALGKIISKKATGDDGLCGKVLKECRLQLSPAILKLFQESIDRHYIPIQWLTAELVPVPKVNLPFVKNNHRPIALRAIIMKSFERIALKHLYPEDLLDKFQFAYISIKREMLEKLLVL